MTYDESNELNAPAQGHSVPDNGIERFKDRLKAIIQGGSLREFSRECGLSEATLRSYLSGDTYPTLDRLEMIARAGKVSATELAFGSSESKKEALSSDSYAYVPLYDAPAAPAAAPGTSAAASWCTCRSPATACARRASHPPIWRACA
nr:helix-turn-helix transcriptional regulator [Pseudomonas sp. ALS1131]